MKRYSSSKMMTLSSVYSSPIRFHMIITVRDGPVETHKQTNTYLIRDQPSCPPSHRVFSGLQGTLANSLWKASLTSLSSFPFCHPPLHLSFCSFTKLVLSTPLSTLLHPIFVIQAWPSTPPLWSFPSMSDVRECSHLPAAHSVPFKWNPVPLIYLPFWLAWWQMFISAQCDTPLHKGGEPSIIGAASEGKWTEAAWKKLHTWDFTPCMSLWSENRHLQFDLFKLLCLIQTKQGFVFGEL